MGVDNVSDCFCPLCRLCVLDCSPKRTKRTKDQIIHEDVQVRHYYSMDLGMERLHEKNKRTKAKNQ